MSAAPKPGLALRQGPRARTPDVPVPVAIKPAVVARPHLRRDDRSDHTLCGYPVLPVMTTYTVAEAMQLSRAGHALPLCGNCVGRFQRLRA